MSDSFYKIFLEELNALETFRMGYISRHKDIPLTKEDPEIRRLIEALAFFSARTRIIGEKNISSVRRRLFQQFFPYLMTPLPSMAIISSVPSGGLTEPIELPSGFEFIVNLDNGKKAFFKSTRDINIIPGEIHRVFMLPLRSGFRLVIKIKTFYPIFKNIKKLNIFINHLNDFEASLKLFYLLKKHILKVSISFEDKVNETTKGIRCNHFFGTEKELMDYSNPLERERLYFHFPWQDLFLNIDLPKAQQGWKHLYIIFDISDKWPQNLLITKEMLSLCSFPIINLLDYSAEPIFCDGTQEAYLIQHPEPEYGFELHSIKGVYELHNSTITPIRPGIFSSRNSSFYEVEERTDKQGKKKHYIYLNIPDAFDEAKLVNIEARWFQPWFSSMLRERIHILPYRQSLEGIDWDLLILPTPHLRSVFWDETESFLQLLTLIHKSFLNKNDIQDILSALGSVEKSYFNEISNSLERVSSETIAYGNDSKLIYRLKFSNLANFDVSIVEAFIKHIQHIVDAWVSQTLVEVKLEN